MTGIMLKDLRETFFIRKNIFEWILAMGLFLILIITTPTRYVYCICIVGMLSMVSVSVLQYSVEQDAVSGFDKIMLTYPLTIKEIILSKYMSGMLLQVAVFVLNFMMALLFSFGYKVIDFSMAMKIWFIGVILSFLFMAVSYMMFFWLGSKKGLILYTIMVIILAIGYSATYYNVDLSGLFRMNRVVLMSAGFLISVLALIGSYFASLKIYTKNHIK